MEMRRKDRQLTETADILEVLSACRVVHVGMIDSSEPYVVALSFGYAIEDGALVIYCHSAAEGRKIAALQKNPSVFVQAEHIGDMVYPTGGPCTYSQKYESFTGTGTAELVCDAAGKAKGLNCIIHHMDANAKDAFVFPEAMLAKTTVLRLVMEDYTAKRKA